jgi:hypothetical protein
MINTNFTNEKLKKWDKKNKKRVKREENIRIIGTLFAFTFINVILLMNFILGPLRLKAYSENVVTILIIELLSVIALSLFLPNITIKYLEKFMKITGAGITLVITSILLGFLYIITLPFAKTIGVKNLLSRHPHVKIWISKSKNNFIIKNDNYSKDEIVTTWQDKKIKIISNKDRTNIKNILLFFIAERNLFLLPIVIILIIIATFMLIASAPVVAPFIYPL